LKGIVQQSRRLTVFIARDVLNLICCNDLSPDSFRLLLDLIEEENLELPLGSIHFHAFTPEMFDSFLSFAKRNNVQIKLLTLANALVLASSRSCSEYATNILLFSQDQAPEVLRKAFLILCRDQMPHQHLEKIKGLLRLALEFNQLQEFKEILLAANFPKLIEALKMTDEWRASESKCVLL
jgi:hypothetical protein